MLFRFLVRIIVRLVRPRRPERRRHESYHVDPRPRPARREYWTPSPPQREFRPAMVGSILCGKAYIIDGDTLCIKKTRIRLAGIDAPEMDQPWGRAAKWALFEICKGQILTAEATGVLSYGRFVATCYLPDGTDIGAELIRSGYALDFTPFSKGKYLHLEPSGARRKFYNLHVGQTRMPFIEGP